MRKLTTTILVFCLATLAFAVGTKEDNKQSSKPVTVKIAAIKGPSGIGMIHLFDKPSGTNFTLQPEALASADAMAARVIAGDVDIAVLPVNMAAKLYNAGRPYQALAIVGNGMLKMLSSDASITSLADLKGKDVYVAGQGATPEFIMRVLLKNAGLDPDSDVKLIFNMPTPEIAASLAANRISIAVLPEPFATLAIKGNSSLVSPFSLSKLWTEFSGQKDYPMTILVGKSDFIKNNPSVVKEILIQYKASIDAVLQNPKEAGALVEKYELGLKAPIAAASIPSSAFVFELAYESRPSIEAMLSIFMQSAPASIGSKLPNEAWYAKLHL